MRRTPKTDKDIFEGLSARYSVDPTTGCHVWTGKRHAETGRAYLRDSGGKVVIAARWILGHIRGHALSGPECTLHTCGNPRCVNPAHLFVGTQGENIADRDFKGRNRASHDMCTNGHDMRDPANVRLYGPENKWRACRACTRAAMARYRLRNRAKLENY